MSLTPLTRLRLAGRMCKLGAWLIGMVGLAVSLFMFFVTYNPTPDNNDPRLLLASLAISGAILVFISFFFIFLFAIGTLFEYIVATGIGIKRRSQEMSDEDELVEITSLP